MTHERRQRAFIAFTVSASCFGLLLWARLLLVTNHPRTALANPTPEEAGYVLPRPVPRLPAPAKPAKGAAEAPAETVPAPAISAQPGTDAAPPPQSTPDM